MSPRHEIEGAARFIAAASANIIDLLSYSIALSLEQVAKSDVVQAFRPA